MEIKIATTQMLKVLLVISWIIFLGICIEAGTFLFNAFFPSVIPVEAKYFGAGIDLTDLYKHDRGYFFVETFLMSIVAVMKALMFYLIIKILQDKKLNLSQPFNKDVRIFILKLAYLALFAGFFSNMGARYAAWFVKQGVKMPDVEYLRLGGADVWLFMGVILLVIAQIFKRGIEIQTENELTV